MAASSASDAGWWPLAKTTLPLWMKVRTPENPSPRTASAGRHRQLVGAPTLTRAGGQRRPIPSESFFRPSAKEYQRRSDGRARHGSTPRLAGESVRPRDLRLRRRAGGQERLAVRTEAQILASLGWPISESEIVARFVGDRRRTCTARSSGTSVARWTGTVSSSPVPRGLRARTGGGARVVEASRGSTPRPASRRVAATTSWSSRSRSPA